MQYHACILRDAAFEYFEKAEFDILFKLVRFFLKKQTIDMYCQWNFHIKF